MNGLECLSMICTCTCFIHSTFKMHVYRDSIRTKTSALLSLFLNDAYKDASWYNN